MRYFALYDEKKKLVGIGTGNGGVGNTKKGYTSLFYEI